MSESPESDPTKRLQASIDTVCEHAARAEIWACALSGFAHPVPHYDADSRYHLNCASNEPAKCESNDAA